MTELDKTITRPGGEKLSLQDGVYTNTSQTTYIPPLQGDPIPRWGPDHPEPLWHSGLGQEVRIIGVNEANGTIQYRIRATNSSDTTERIALEFQLQELAEADRVPEDGLLPVNKAPWAPVKESMLKFLGSYPIPSAETRRSLEAQIKSKNKGLASAVLDERNGDVGFFSGEANFTERMQKRSPGFPWNALAPLFDYSLPQR